MGRTDDAAARASNWRTILVTDGALGVVVCVAGVVLALRVAMLLGAAVIAIGSGYTALVAARARRWARLRRGPDA